MRATCRTVGNRPTQEVPQRASTSAPGARSRNSADIKSGIDKCLIARPTVTGGNDVVCDGQDIISSIRARRSSESVHESSSGLALTPVTRPGRSRMSSSFSVLVEADDQCWISSTRPRSRSHTASLREPFEVVTAVSWPGASSSGGGDQRRHRLQPPGTVGCSDKGFRWGAQRCTLLETIDPSDHGK
jgi:hypothetical protein